VPEVVLVLATGSGKSLTFMLASRLPGAKTTVVIIPLVLLRLDLIRRCRELGLNPVVWSNSTAAGLDGSQTLLFVSVEVAARPSFRQYMRELYDKGYLERVMLDECHLIHTSAHYRRHMAQLSQLRQYAVQFVYMTATLPPRLEAVLYQRHHIGRARVVRGSTRRRNIRYGVEYMRPPKSEGFLSFVCRAVKERWERLSLAGWTDGRVMIFVRSCGDAEEIARQMQCSYFHRDIGTTEEKEARLEGWMSGASGSAFLACTTAAGAGVDYAHVRWVVHIEDPYGVSEFQQESGRGGRDGAPAGSTVLMRRDPRLPGPGIALDHYDPHEQEVMGEYLSGLECRRLVLGREFDEAKEWVECGAGEVKCDVCEVREERGAKGCETEEGWAEEEEEDEGERGAKGCETEEGRAEEEEEEEEGEEGEEGETVLDGAIRYRRNQMREQYEMDSYIRRLSQIQGQCMLCRILVGGSEWKHELSKCSRMDKWRYFACRKAVVEKSRGRGWIKSYMACYLCGQPQRICKTWEKTEREGWMCEYRDLVMPAVWGLWESVVEREWVESRLEVKVSNGEEALIAAARGSEFGGSECILGVKILAELLERWG
jgi:superfamily II DNA or RNA helicase